MHTNNISALMQISERQQQAVDLVNKLYYNKKVVNITAIITKFKTSKKALIDNLGKNFYALIKEQNHNISVEKIKAASLKKSKERSKARAEAKAKKWAEAKAIAETIAIAKAEVRERQRSEVFVKPKTMTEAVTKANAKVVEKKDYKEVLKEIRQKAKIVVLSNNDSNPELSTFRPPIKPYYTGTWQEHIFGERHTKLYY